MATRARLVTDYMRAAGGYSNIETEGSGTGLLAQVSYQYHAQTTFTFEVYTRPHIRIKARPDG